MTETDGGDYEDDDDFRSIDNAPDDIDFGLAKPAATSKATSGLLNRMMGDDTGTVASSFFATPGFGTPVSAAGSLVDNLIGDI